MLTLNALLLYVYLSRKVTHSANIFTFNCLFWARRWSLLSGGTEYKFSSAKRELKQRSELVRNPSVEQDNIMQTEAAVNIHTIVSSLKLCEERRTHARQRNEQKCNLSCESHAASILLCLATAMSSVVWAQVNQGQ